MKEDDFKGLAQVVETYTRLAAAARGHCTPAEQREICIMARAMVCYFPGTHLKHIVRRARLALLCKRDGPLCHYCGEKLNFNPKMGRYAPNHPLPNDCGPEGRWRATFDHVIPRSRGGSDHLDNLVLSCYPCNSAKGNS